MSPLKDELTLLLIYLNGWKQNSVEKAGGTILRTWRGYPFDILNKMEKNGLLTQYANSVALTDKGKEEAEKLKEKYEKHRTGKQGTKSSI